MPKRLWIILWVAAMVLLFYANGSLWVTDSVECNYALTAKEMVLSGDWVSPQIFGHYWFDKPIFFYWLTALSYSVLGFTEFASRLAPAVMGLIGLVLLAWGARKLYNERSSYYSVLVLLSSIEFFLISKSIITDSTFFLFFSATLLFFYLGYTERKALYWYTMYASAGLTVLTKGPIGVLLPGLIITLFLLWKRDWRILTQCHLLTGTLLTCLVCVPWYYVMYLRHGMDFIGIFLGTHNVLRATVSEHPRDDVFYYYTMINALALFPWSGMVPVVVYERWRQRNWHLGEKEGFLVIWAATIFVFFQLMATKYITYTYPALFPTALLLGHLLEKRSYDFFRNRFNLGFLVLIYGALMGAAVWVVKDNIVSGEHIYLAPVGLFVGLVVAYVLLKQGVEKPLSLAALSLIFYLCLIEAIAVPLSARRSGYELGQMLDRRMIKAVCTFGSYSTSATYYSKAKIIDLVSQERLKTIAPRSFDWSVKNVMPFAAIENIPTEYVVTQPERIAELEKRSGKRWQEVERSGGRWVLLIRVAD